MAMNLHIPTNIIMMRFLVIYLSIFVTVLVAFVGFTKINDRFIKAAIL